MTGMHSDLLENVLQRAKRESKLNGRDALVAELLQSYLASRPEDARVWVLYGNALRELGRNQEGLNALVRAFDIAEGEHKGHIAMHIAMLVKDFKSPGEAQKWFHIGTASLGSKEGWPWILYGVNHFLLGDFDAAIECFETVLGKGHDEEDEAFLNMGIVHRAMGNYSHAATFFEKALVVNSECDQAREMLNGLSGIDEVISLVGSLKSSMH